MGIHSSHDNQPVETWRLVLFYVACYLFWLTFSALGFLLFGSLRTNVFDLATALQLNGWQVRTVDRFAIYGLGLLWFLFVLWLESYLRHGVDRHQLWTRIGRVALAMGALGILSYGLRWVVAA